MIELFAGVGLILGMVCGYLLWMLHKQTASLQALEERVGKLHKHLEDEVRMASRGAFGVGKRLIDAEKRLGELSERIEQVENLHAADQNSRQARRILQKTVIEEEPTRSEAKLAALLKGEAEEEFP